MEAIMGAHGRVGKGSNQSRLRFTGQGTSLGAQMHAAVVLGRPSVAGPVFARVFGPQTGVQKNHFFRSLEGAKSLENL